MTYNIFIEGQKIPLTNVNCKLKYLYDGCYLEVYVGKRFVYRKEATAGDAFVVIYKNGKALLNEMTPPTSKGGLVSWLLKFNKDTRAGSMEKYWLKLERERKRRYWYGYEEKPYTSENYVFMLCNSHLDDRVRNVAGFFSDAITKEEVISLIPLMVYHPDWYIANLLKENFYISEEEFKAARAAKFPL